MNWNNHGEYWHYDHVKPCKSFDLSKEIEIEICFNWKNIRPLNKTENIKKSSIIDENIISSHNNIVLKFLTLHDVPS